MPPNIVQSKLSLYSFFESLHLDIATSSYAVPFVAFAPAVCVIYTAPYCEVAKLNASELLARDLEASKIEDTF